MITGPNAGGKTVALKTAGILALLAQCGLPMPAAPGSRVPFLRRLVATVGDEQDLLADRSTFSGRLLRLKEAWEAAGPDSLILLDELGSGTDPEEGAALAVRAARRAAGEAASLGVITTHLGRSSPPRPWSFPAPPARPWSSTPATGRPTSGSSPARRAAARRWRSPAGWACPPSGSTAPRRGWAPSTATSGG